MKVLVADDSTLSRRMIEGLVRSWGWDVVTAADGEAAWQILDGENPPRVAILDWEMPGLSGVELCRRLRERAGVSYVYTIVLTARASHGNVVAALEAGADDYVQKPFDSAELRVRVRAGTRLAELEDRLTVQATRDGLTGAYNRAAGLDFLQREVSRAHREHWPLAVMMLDLDAFKAVNDTWGHAVGDAVLQETAARLASTLRGYDILVRYGGEEFVVVLPGCALDGAVRAAERCRAEAAALSVATAKGDVPVTVSIGVAALDDGDTMERLLDRADRELYRAKNLGRNRVEPALGAPRPDHEESPRDAARANRATA